MKCPKCGFNSFEYLDNCKKCGNDLTGFKKSSGVKPIVMAAIAATSPASVVTGPQEPIAPAGEGTARPDEMFQWETPASAQPSGKGGATFSDFELDLGAAQPTAQPPTDPFAFVNEFESAAEVPSTESQPTAAEENPFHEFSFTTPPPPSAEPFSLTDFGVTDHSPETAKQPVSDFSIDSFGDLPEADQQRNEQVPATPLAGDFDLESLLMEESSESTSKEKKAPGKTELTTNEFDSLFGDIDLQDTKK